MVHKIDISLLRSYVCESQFEKKMLNGRHSNLSCAQTVIYSKYAFVIKLEDSTMYTYL